MPVLRIEHTVTSFDRWKDTFDSDPLDRKASGVRRYRVFRSVAEPDLVMIDLELDSVDEAERMLGRLQELWAGPAKALMQGPQARIVEEVDAGEP